MSTEITTTDMHTGGEPVRIVTSGYPPLQGTTLLEKRRYARDHLDHLRRLLMWEPRGHADMYGVIPTTPDHPEADAAVLFMHNEGYSTMCGHGTIALGRWLVDGGMVPVTEPTTMLRLQVPAGLVEVTVDVRNGVTGAASYRSTPSFLAATAMVDVAGHGPVPVAAAYGGAFYALARASDLGLDLAAAGAAELATVGHAVTVAAGEAIDVAHPDSPDLGFFYGTILDDGGDGAAEPSRNVCVFADRQVDRSPTGSGVQARLAAQHAAGAVAVGEERRFRSLTGAVFTGRVEEATTVGEHPAVVVAVGGRAHYTGRHTFLLDEDDDVAPFLLR